MRCPPKQLFKGGRLCAFSPLVVAALLLVLLCFFSPSFVVLSARGAEVVPTSGAASIESNFPDAAANAASALTTNADAAGYPTRARIPLAGMVASVASALVSRSVAAFKSSQPTFEARLDVAPLSVQVKQAFFSRGGYDFAVSTSSPSTSDFQKMPSLAYYPLNGNGVVFTYNLPTEVSNGQTLALTGAALCRIYRGNITRWDDPALVVANPTMALGGSAAAGKLIRVMFMTTSSATVLAFTRYCGKIDPLFKSLIPAKGLPTYPSTLYSFNYTDLDQMNSGVSDNLFSFAVTALSNAAEVNLPVGAFLNAQGNTPVLPSSSSMALTLFELATNGYPAGLSEFDLTNPSTAQAWSAAAAAAKTSAPRDARSRSCVRMYCGTMRTELCSLLCCALRVWCSLFKQADHDHVLSLRRPHRRGVHLRQ
jgi:phosphate transport system substrate-binding protein